MSLCGNGLKGNILDCLKMKAFAGDKINLAKMLISHSLIG